LRPRGAGQALRVDHLEADEVANLVARVEREQGRLDVLVNDIFGGDRYAQWDKKLWEHDLDGGLRMVRMGIDTAEVERHAGCFLASRADAGMRSGPPSASRMAGSVPRSTARQIVCVLTRRSSAAS
jgi:NAD(P)-dependent dehydrogenase (short-subunit alcohol dehydrogenase family)